MKKRGMQALLGVGLVTFAWVTNAQTGSDAQDDSSAAGRLRRAPATPRSGSFGRAQSAEEQARFDAHAWKQALGESDLDRRQASYDELLDIARRDPAARAALDEWAGGHDELAWTSRLALRELSRTPSSSRSLQPFDPFAGEGLDSLFEMPFDARAFDHRQLFGDIEKRLDELFGRLPSAGAAPLSPSPGASSHGQSFQLESTPDGVKVRVEEEKDGRTETREYEAKDMDELLELYPELRDHIGTDPFGAPDLRADLDELRERLHSLRRPWQDPVAPATPRQVPTDVLGVYVAAVEDQGGGLRVDRIEPGTIAKAMGIQRGDVLLEINGIPLASAEDVSHALKQRQPDQELAVKLRDRQGSERTLTWKPPVSGNL